MEEQLQLQIKLEDTNEDIELNFSTEWIQNFLGITESELTKIISGSMSEQEEQELYRTLRNRHIKRKLERKRKAVPNGQKEISVWYMVKQYG